MKKLLKNKIFIIISVLVLVCIVGIIVGIIMFVPKENKPSDKKKESSFADRIEGYSKINQLQDTIKKELELHQINTTKVKMIGIDLDSDDDLELVAYAEGTDNKIIMIFEEFEDKTGIHNNGFFTATEDAKIGYAYSIEDDKDYWYEKQNDYYRIQSDEQPMINKDEFEDKYYVIKEEDFKDVEEFDLDKDKFDKKEFEKNVNTNEEVIEKEKTTQKEIVEKAKEYQEERQNQKEEEEKKKAEEEVKKAEEEKKKQEPANKSQNSNSLTLNGFIIPFGKYTADPVIYHQNIQLNSNGTANADGVECTWTKGTHDFAQDESSAGHPRESITLNCAGEIEYLSAFQNNELSNGGIMNYNYVG